MGAPSGTAMLREGQSGGGPGQQRGMQGQQHEQQQQRQQRQPPGAPSANVVNLDDEEEDSDDAQVGIMGSAMLGGGDASLSLKNDLMLSK